MSAQTERTNGGLLAPLRTSRQELAIGLLTAGSAALLAGAWFFQLVVGLEPCRLCLDQRWPHYAVLIVGTTVLLALRLGKGGDRLRLPLALLLGLLLLSSGLAAYHVGVELGWFLGPTDCGAAAPLGVGGSAADFMRQLQTTRVVSCKAVQWSLFGISMAGWNGLVSAGLAALAGVALARR